MISTTYYVSVLGLSVAVLVAFASAQGYGNTIMISSEMPYVVSDVLEGGGISVTWPGSRLINVVPSNGLQVQRVPGGVRPRITQEGGIPLTIPSGMPSVMPGNGIPVLGEMPSSFSQVFTGTGMPQVITGPGMPQVITGTRIQRIMPAVGMPGMMPGMGMPFITGDMMDVFKDYYQTVDMMNMLGLGQSVDMNRHRYPAQRRAMINKRTTPSSPSTEPIAKAKATQRPI